jgi:ribonuclease P protein component
MDSARAWRRWVVGEFWQNAAPKGASVCPHSRVAARLPRLKKRPDFVRIAKTGRSKAMPGLVLQCAPRDPTWAGSLPRVGFTASRRVGGAVERNRARRRLRAVADQVMIDQASRDRDYVVIARATTRERDYAALTSDLRRALEKLGALRAVAQPAGNP